MTEITVKIGSVTNAQRAKSVLIKHGYRCVIRRSLTIKKGDGCGYSVLTNCPRREVITLLDKAGIKIISVE